MKHKNTDELINDLTYSITQDAKHEEELLDKITEQDITITWLLIGTMILFLVLTAVAVVFGNVPFVIINAALTGLFLILLAAIV